MRAVMWVAGAAVVELRSLCGSAGEVLDLIQSGKSSSRKASRRRSKAAREAIEKTFGHSARIVSTAANGRIPKGNRSAAAKDEPNRLMLLLSKAPPAKGAEDAIQARAQAGERVKQAGDALWFHYPLGAGTSKLTPGLIDRATGSPGTARNYRTVTTLLEMLNK